MILDLLYRHQVSLDGKKHPNLAGLALLVFFVSLLSAGASSATGDEIPSLDLGQPYLRGGFVWLDLTMSAMIRGEVLDALHSGLPATVVFEWRIWQRRDGWWDHSVGDGATYFRVFYDVLQNRYDVFDYRGRAVASSDDTEKIEEIISEGPGLKLVSANILHAEQKYFVEVLARIELLDEEEVRSLKDWLSGSKDGKNGFNVVGAMSEQMAKILGGIVGPNEKTIVSKTEDFYGF